MKTTLKALCNSSDIPAPLIRAVVRQLGGWESFQESAPDINNHGLSGGFSGFTYYTDTVAFARKNRATIAQMAENDARDFFGQGVLEMIQGFPCLQGDFTQAEIARCLYGRSNDTHIMNALAWYAGESVARVYCDLCEQA